MRSADVGRTNLPSGRGERSCGPETPFLACDHLDELDSLVRLADVLADATAGEGTTGVNAMAQAMAIRLGTLADGVRLARGAAIA